MKLYDLCEEIWNTLDSMSELAKEFIKEYSVIFLGANKVSIVRRDKEPDVNVCRMANGTYNLRFSTNDALMKFDCYVTKEKISIQELRSLSANEIIDIVQTALHRLKTGAEAAMCTAETVNEHKTEVEKQLMEI